MRGRILNFSILPFTALVLARRMGYSETVTLLEAAAAAAPPSPPQGRRWLGGDGGDTNVAYCSPPHRLAAHRLRSFEVI